MSSSDLINLTSTALSCNLYLGDDLNLNLSEGFGSFLQSDPSATVTAALFLNGVAVTAFIAQPDLSFGSDFTNGEFYVTIENSVLDLLARTTGYRVVVRIVSNTLQSTYVTLSVLNLLPL